MASPQTCIIMMMFVNMSILFLASVSFHLKKCYKNRFKFINLFEPTSWFLLHSLIKIIIKIMRFIEKKRPLNCVCRTQPWQAQGRPESQFTLGYYMILRKTTNWDYQASTRARPSKRNPWHSNHCRRHSLPAHT